MQISKKGRKISGRFYNKVFIQKYGLIEAFYSHTK